MIVVLVRVQVLTLAYSRISIIDGLCRGADRWLAAASAVDIYFWELAPERNENDDEAVRRTLAREVMHAARHGELDKYRGLREVALGSGLRQMNFNCVLRGAHVARTLLRVPPGPLAEGVELPDTEVDRVDWLLEAARRVADGQEYLAAARSAYDEYLGKVRRRRAPVDSDWLAAEAAASLDAIWAALARRGPRPIAYTGPDTKLRSKHTLGGMR